MGSDWISLIMKNKPHKYIVEFIAFVFIGGTIITAVHSFNHKHKVSIDINTLEELRLEVLNPEGYLFKKNNFQNYYKKIINGKDLIVSSCPRFGLMYLDDLSIHDMFEDSQRQRLCLHLESQRIKNKFNEIGIKD